MNAGWWRRNRVWLALLVPLLLLALGASSFRLVRLYLPWQWSRPIVAHSTTGVLRQSSTHFDGVRRDREVRVTVASLDPHESYGDAKAVGGGVVWRLVLGLEAEPDQFLEGCEVELTDADGNRYDFASGLEPVDEDVYYVPPALIGCVPEDAPGPRLDPLSGAPIDSPAERPRAWEQEVLIAMPRGVDPIGVRVMWRLPVYLELEVP